MAASKPTISAIRWYTGFRPASSLERDDSSTEYIGIFDHVSMLLVKPLALVLGEGRKNRSRDENAKRFHLLVKVALLFDNTLLKVFHRANVTRWTA